MWAGAVSLVLIPVYVRFMGVEAYGLVGFFMTLQALLSLLDAGLSITLNREFARLSAAADGVSAMRRVLRTFETIYWGIALAAGFTVTLLAGWIASEWFEPGKLSNEDVRQTVVLMGIAFVFQWPLALYGGGLLGLQRQVTLSAITAASATLRGAGAVLILWLVSPTVQAFFVWQVVVSFAHTAAAAFALWRGIGGVRNAGFDLMALRATWRFSAGMTVITVLLSLLTQLDKAIVSNSLPLETFGYYALAGTVAASLYRVTMPVFSAVFPRISQLVARNADHEMRSLYHTTAQTMSAAVLPAAVFVALFAHELLLLWTRDTTTADNSHLVLSLLVGGTALNGVFSVPYAVQLAHGWTRLVIVTNLIAIAVMVPAMLVLSKTYGAPGAAFVWLAYNVSAAIIVPAVMHARILRGELARWYFLDVGAPLLVVLLIGGVARLLFHRAGSGLLSLALSLLPVAVLMQVGAVLATSTVRRRVLLWLRPQTTH